ncbi:MAG: riboflavin synthase [Candidatus Marinimicrobia bacterium]|nr:riboflavin synthase [Candidatus Neomarinimicrobiota bacterium]|tara:strand:+ start:536 stop:1138 length:603 start_codon:yes stop_codon:yes gene_type:complete
MFTGIIEQVGVVSNIEHYEDLSNLRIEVSKEFGMNSKIGDSISINGTCLTITKIMNGNIYTFDFNVVKETIEKTNLKYLKTFDSVNLEKSLMASSRFDGHIVQGHVEGLGKIKKITKDNNSFIVTIDLPEKLSCYCINKGSIAVNGVSLTIAKIEENLIDIWIIPHTLSNTTFGKIKENDFVNIETDIIGKYIKKFSSIN